MKYIFVKQHDSQDCAAACMAMICLYYNKQISITEIRDLCGTDIKGTSFLGLAECAEKLGLTSKAVRVDKSGLLSDYTKPAIANILTRDGLSHFVVIFGITRKNVIVGDPAKDLVRIPLDEFVSSFSGSLLLLKPSNQFESNKRKDWGMLDRYLRLLFPQKKLFIFSMLASLFITGVGIVLSLFNSVIFDEVLPYQQKDALKILMLIFGVITFSSIIMTFIKQWMLTHLSIRINIPLMLGYFSHVFKLPMRFFSSRKTGEITTRFSDAFTIKDIFTNISLSLCIDTLMASISGVILWYMNSKLFCIIVFQALANFLILLLFKPSYKKTNEEQMQQNAILNSEIIESLRGIETIKGNSYEKYELETIEKEYIKSLKIGYKESMISNTQRLAASIISSVGHIALLFVGISGVISNEISLGEYMSFMTLATYFTDPLNSIVGVQMQIQEAHISMTRLAEIMDYEEEQGGACQELSAEAYNSCFRSNKVSEYGDIVFSNVSFRYGMRKPALNNVSFTIPKGKKVAIVGTSGSGKSTIIKLLLKYYEPDAGRITINGVDIKEYSNIEMRKTISYVPQNIELFSKSIIDNIRIGKTFASLNEVKDAAKKSKAHDFIIHLPNQYYTCLQEAGNGLSGGERQRIVLARAFLKNSNLFILDESTSSLDFITENAIFDYLYNFCEEKTMIIVAHRLSTIRACDNIIVMDEGQVIEQGSHDELISRKGRYYMLWEMQQGYKISDEDCSDDNLIERQSNICVAEEDVMEYA